MRLASLNKSGFGMTRGAAMGLSAKIKAVRETVRAQMLPYAARGKLVTIRATRIGGKLDDDNLVGAFKPVLDGIARAFGVNDKTFVILGDRPGVRVYPEQRFEGRGVFAVELEIEVTD
jgi:hypothetical protein